MLDMFEIDAKLLTSSSFVTTLVQIYYRQMIELRTSMRLTRYRFDITVWYLTSTVTHRPA